jgi:hypothetical protein
VTRFHVRLDPKSGSIAATHYPTSWAKSDQWPVAYSITSSASTSRLCGTSAPPEASGTALIARPGANPPSAAPLSIAAHVIRYLVLTRANSCSVVGTNSACASPTSRRNLHFKRPRRQCLVAAADLPSRPEKRGRKAKDWYVSVLTLLLSIAEKAGIKPTLYKAREAERELPAGWLLDAARELETFLPAEMRSPSDIARYKRLERSKAKA